MAGLSTNAPGLWGGFAGLLYGSTSLSTPPGFLADAPPAWVPTGGVLAFDFADGLGYNSRNLATTTPDSILTYTSPSAKMVYGSDGVLRYAPHNLLTNSNWAGNYSGDDWTPTGWAYTSATGTGTAAASARSTSDLSIRFETTAARQILSIGFAVVGGMNYRLSFDLEAMPVAINWLQIFTSATIGATIITYNGTGTNGLTPPTAGMIGTRVYIDFTAGSTGTMGLRLGCGVSSNITGDITISRPMITNLPIPGQTYFQNTSTTAAVYSLPIDHNPTTFEPLGVLIEEQRVNLLQWSQEFNNTGSWFVPAGATIAADNITAPDGTLTADKLTRAATSGVALGYGNMGNGLALTAGVHTLSYFAKADTQTSFTVALVTGGKALGSEVLLTLSAGTAGEITHYGATTGSVATIQELNGGWYRCSLTVTVTTATWFMQAEMPSAGAYWLWGAQLEAGAFATSLISTQASQVTRAADQVSILTSAFGYNAAAGTMVVEAMFEGRRTTAGFEVWAALDNGTSTNTSLMVGSNGLADNTARSLALVSTAVVADLKPTGALAVNTLYKQAFAFAANDFAACRGGGTVVTDTIGAMPSGITTLRFRRESADDSNFSGWIKRFTYFPTRRSNADLQVLTRGDDLVWGIGDYLVWGSGNNLTW